MKQISKRVTVLALALALMAPISLLAQKDDKDKPEKEKKETKETDQLIINRKTDSKDKVVIEINGDKITVNGKPLDEFKSDDISVHRSRFRTFNDNDFNYNYQFDGKNFMTLSDNKAMLGVTTQKAENGVEVQSVTKESAAEKAGIKEGDVISKIDNTKITETDDLSNAIQKHKPGEKVDVTFFRDKKEQKVNVELTQWKGARLFTPMGDNNFKMDMAIPRFDNLSRNRGGQSWSWSTGSPKLGLSVQDTDDGKGVKVIDVDEESTASKAGVKEDDVITEIDGKPINNTDDITKVIRESKDKPSVMVKLSRGGKTQNIEVKMPHRIKTADL